MSNRPQRRLMMVNILLAAAIVGLLVLRSRNGSLKTALPEPVEFPAPSTVVAPAVTETPTTSVAPSVPAPAPPPPVTASLPAPQAIAELPAEEILRRADEVRNPQIDYTLTVTVTSVKRGNAAQTATYEVLVKGRDNTVIKTLSPRVDRGRVLLMKGRDLWAYLPTISKPLRISLRERLIGDVANGDLARANFSGDYTPALLRLDRLGDRDYYALTLTANAEDVTYAKVVLWVDRETFHPHHAEFYAVSGRLLKSCAYEDDRELGGAVRPTRLVMRDALAAGQTSTIVYDRIEVAPLPEKYFTKDYMKKWME